MRKPVRKRPWSQPLADLVGAAIDPLLARQGFGESDLILNWDDIVGERLAASSRPIKLVWPPRPPARQADTAPQPATLMIRVEGGFALELQHMSDQLIARINAHLGWRCVGRLGFKQGPIPRADVARGARVIPTAEALAAAGARVEGIEDAALHAALARLAAHVRGADLRVATLRGADLRGASDETA